MKEMGVSVGNNIPTIDYVKSMQELIDEIRKMLFGFTFKRHLLRGFFIKSGRILRSFFSLQISFQIPPLTLNHPIQPRLHFLPLRHHLPH